MLFVVSWNVLCQLAPWLLLGMLLSGVMQVFLPAGYVRRRFRGVGGVAKAVLLGIPLPLCSCGVVPAGIGLKNQGASTGASIGFLISTPQTGVDSILVSTSFFGWPFALFKMVTAAITGIAGGWLADLADLESGSSGADSKEKLEQNQIVPGNSDTFEKDTVLSRIQAIGIHGIEIMRSIWVWLMIGVLVSAAIDVYLPETWFLEVGGWGLFPAMFLVLVLATPLYVCATASVPIAAALVAGGLPPAVALVFLMAGPATNVTTMGAIFSRFGWKTLAIYLMTIVLGSMLFAAVFDWLLTADVAKVASHDHEHSNWWSMASAVILLAIIGSFVWTDFRRWIKRRLQADSDSPRIEITIDGMTCGGCVSRIETAILKCEDVQSVSVDLKTGLAVIVGTAEPDKLVDLVESLGFRVPKPLKVTK